MDNDVAWLSILPVTAVQSSILLTLQNMRSGRLSAGMAMRWRAQAQLSNVQGGQKVMPKKVLVAFPQSMLEQMDVVAKLESRTRSDLVREAIRRYLDMFKKTNGIASGATASTVTLLESAYVNSQ
jgi:Arc/MetJ-type ribon-helix-helix transcriptional regulator